MKLIEFDLNCELKDILKDYGLVDTVSIIRDFLSTKDTENMIIDIVELIADLIRKLEKLIFCGKDHREMREHERLIMK